MPLYKGNALHWMNIHPIWVLTSIHFEIVDVFEKFRSGENSVAVHGQNVRDTLMQPILHPKKHAIPSDFIGFSLRNPTGYKSAMPAR